MKEYDIYIFDFDGTLFDSLESLYPTFRYAFDAIGMHNISDEQIESFTHVSLTDTMDNMNVPQKDRPLFIEKICEALDIVEFMKLIKPFPEMLETVEELKRRGKKMAIVSNNDTGHIETVLELLNIPPLFDTVVGSDQVKRAKPYPDMLFEAFDRMGVADASRACYVGDSLQDGDTAVAAGIGSIIVDRHRLYEKVPGDKCYSLKEMLDY